MENSYGQFHEIMKKASYVRERVYEKTETINPELKKYWEEYAYGNFGVTVEAIDRNLRRQEFPDSRLLNEPDLNEPLR